MKAIQKLDETKTIRMEGSNMEYDTFETSELVIVGKNVLLVVKKISDEDIFILEKDAILEFYIENSLHIIQSCLNKLVATQLISKSKIIDFFTSYCSKYSNISFANIALTQFHFFRKYTEYKQNDTFEQMCSLRNFEFVEVDKEISKIYADNWHMIYAIAKDISNSNLNVLPVELVSYIFSFVGGDINFSSSDNMSNDDHTPLTGQSTEVSYE